MTGSSSESDGNDVDGCSRALESVTLEPHGSEWSSLVKRTPLSAFQIRLREQLGLPTDRPVIMSGHQAELWHPGILAKWLAGAALARHVGGVFCWLHVDQDTNEPGLIDVPAFDASGMLVKRTLALIDQTKDIPTGARPAQRVDPARARPAHGETLVNPDAVMRIVDALNQCASAPTLALQFGRTAEFLVRNLTDESTAPAHAITASQLAATDAFATMVDLLRRDPVRAIEAHNVAAAESLEAGIRALGVKRSTSPEQQPRVELPLWRVTSGAPRTPVMLSQLDAIPLAELRPRALLMTGLARLAACDLFIHGTGGGIYDRITDAWFESWLGGADMGDVRESLPSAPMTVATATARLSFDPRHGGATDREAQHASHAAHHARHNPHLLNDESAARAKRDLVDRIARSTDQSERAALFREMHTLLAGVRSARATQLDALENAARTATRRAAEHSVVTARTWPFALYPDATLAALLERIEQEICP